MVRRNRLTGAIAWAVLLTLNWGCLDSPVDNACRCTFAGTCVRYLETVERDLPEGALNWWPLPNGTIAYSNDAGVAGLFDYFTSQRVLLPAGRLRGFAAPPGEPSLVLIDDTLYSVSTDSVTALRKVEGEVVQTHALRSALVVVVGSARSLTTLQETRGQRNVIATFEPATPVFHPLREYSEPDGVVLHEYLDLTTDGHTAVFREYAADGAIREHRFSEGTLPVGSRPQDGNFFALARQSTGLERSLVDARGKTLARDIGPRRQFFTATTLAWIDTAPNETTLSEINFKGTAEPQVRSTRLELMGDSLLPTSTVSLASFMSQGPLIVERGSLRMRFLCLGNPG